MRRWGGLALGTVFAGAAIGLAHLAPPPRDEPAMAPAPPPIDAPIEPHGEALIYRALLVRERGDRYGAYAMGRAIASGAAGPVAAERARVELLAQPPLQTVTLPLTNAYRELRFDERGQVEVVGPDHRTVFDPSTGETIRDVSRRAHGERPAQRSRLGTKVRASDEWRALRLQDRQREESQRRTRVTGSTVIVLEGREELGRVEAPEQVDSFVRAAISTDGSTVCAGTHDGHVSLQALDGDSLLVGQLESAITVVVPLPEREGEAPAFLVGTRRGEVARVTRGRERDRYGRERRDGSPVVAFEMLARSGPPVAWAGAEAEGTPIVVDGEGILIWAREQRLTGVTVDPVRVSRRIVSFDESEEVLDVALDPEGGRIAVLSRDALRIIALEPGLPLCPVPGGDLDADARTARDTSRVVVRNRDVVAVCDVETPGEPLLTVAFRNEDEARHGRAELSADGRLLFVGGHTETRIVEVDSGERVGRLHHEWGATVSPDGSVASIGTGLVATADGSPVHPDCFEERGQDLRFLEEAELIVGIEDERLVVCELDDEGDLLFRTERYADLPGPGHYGGVGTSADGSHLWLGTGDGRVRLFELPGGRLVRTFHAGESGVPQATVANGGAYVMTESSQGRSRLFVTATGERVLEREAEPMGTDGPGAPPETFTGDGEHYVRVFGIREGSQTTWVSATGEELPVTRPIDYGLEVEVRGHAFPLGSGPDLVATSGEGLAILRATPDGLRPLMRVRPSATATTSDGRFIVWWGDSVRQVPVGTSGPDAAALTAGLSNYRVCRESFDPVAVTPAEIDDPIWAPDGYCD